MIFLDLKTSGPNPEKHGILSFAVVDSKRAETGSREYYKSYKLELGRDKRMESGYLEMYGFEERDVRNPSQTKKPKKVLKELVEWMQKASEDNLAGLNLEKKLKFLKKAMQENDIVWPFNEQYIDLFTTAINAYKIERVEVPKKGKGIDLSFDQILWSVGLERVEEIPSALEDAMLEAEAYFRLVYGKNLIKSLRGNFMEVRGFENYPK